MPHSKVRDANSLIVYNSKFIKTPQNYFNTSSNLSITFNIGAIESAQIEMRFQAFASNQVFSINQRYKTCHTGILTFNCSTAYEPTIIVQVVACKLLQLIKPTIVRNLLLIKSKSMFILIPWSLFITHDYILGARKKHIFLTTNESRFGMSSASDVTFVAMVTEAEAWEIHVLIIIQQYVLQNRKRVKCAIRAGGEYNIQFFD